MQNVTMTAEQTQVWDENGPAAVELIQSLHRDIERTRKPGETVEIYTADGTVANVVQG